MDFSHTTLANRALLDPGSHPFAPGRKASKIFHHLADQLDAVYRLPRLTAVAGIPDDDPIASVLLGMLQAAAGRYVAARKGA